MRYYVDIHAAILCGTHAAVRRKVNATAIFMTQRFNENGIFIIILFFFCFSLVPNIGVHTYDACYYFQYEKKTALLFNWNILFDTFRVHASRWCVPTTRTFSCVVWIFVYMCRFVCVIYIYIIHVHRYLVSANSISQRYDYIFKYRYKCIKIHKHTHT